MNDELAISVKNVSKDFRLPHEKTTSVKRMFTKAFSRKRGIETQHALKDVSFDIKKGEFFGIVGRNGSGKSTLLKMLAGIYQPTKGEVTVNGKLVPFIELGVGFTPELTGRENVYLNGALLGFSKKEIDAQYDDIVQFAELEDSIDQKLKNYSSGMQVRLAFSVATRAKADILLIDEVLAVGDADFQRKCFSYFHELKKQKKTVVFVSHDMDAIREYCDRAVLIEKSEIVDIGQTSKIAEQYTKLFTKEAPTQELADNTGRWGSRDVTIEDIHVDITDKKIIISQTLLAHTKTNNPIVGFRIRNSQGRDVTGTNTKIEQKMLGELDSGDEVKLTWNFDNILSDGEYTIDPAILGADGITVFDWWDNAVNFAIKKSRHLPYDIDPAFHIELDREKAKK